MRCEQGATEFVECVGFFNGLVAQLASAYEYVYTIIRAQFRSHRHILPFYALPLLQEVPSFDPRHSLPLGPYRASHCSAAAPAPSCRVGVRLRKVGEYVRPCAPHSLYLARTPQTVTYSAAS